MTTASNGVDALNRAREVRPDLVVLDVMLPGMDGFEVARTLRKDRDRVPVVFLTAQATPPRTRCRASPSAATTTSPSRSAWRRSSPACAPSCAARPRADDAEPATAQLSFADVVLDDDTHQVWKAGEEVELSPTEFKLLRYLLQNPGRVLSKRQILEHVWNYDFGGDGNVVESYVSYLRKKVDTGDERLLHTVRGVGYVLRAGKR